MGCDVRSLDSRCASYGGTYFLNVSALYGIDLIGSSFSDEVRLEEIYVGAGLFARDVVYLKGLSILGGVVLVSFTCPEPMFRVSYTLTVSMYGVVWICTMAPMVVSTFLVRKSAGGSTSEHRVCNRWTSAAQPYEGNYASHHRGGQSTGVVNGRTRTSLPGTRGWKRYKIPKTHGPVG